MILTSVLTYSGKFPREQECLYQLCFKCYPSLQFGWRRFRYVQRDCLFYQHYLHIVSDWEYPGAADRGGTSKDAANFVSLVKEMRDAFDVVDRAYTITATIPTSYWYLRGFDLKGMQEHVSWFNLMAYDLVSFLAKVPRTACN